MSQAIYISTSIPYVNARPHIGHALEFVQADAIARAHRLAGNPVVFQTGTDENAAKNVLAARARGLTPQALVDENAAVFRALVDALHVSADTFLRTTDPRHTAGVIAFWQRLRPDDLNRQRYRGAYCIGCEDFLVERDLRGGRCAEHDVVPEVIEEENVFFRLSRYAGALRELIARDRLRIVPEGRKREVLAFIEAGLSDISVSRARHRSAGWGIAVPGDAQQIIYVWIDALINYLSGRGFGTSAAWQNVWREETKKVHVIGKNVVKFHAVYWPALLLSAGLPLPDELFVHGFVTENGRKIGKSTGNAVDPFALIDRYGADGVRHFLLAALSPFSDGDYAADKLEHVYVGGLANGLGNVYGRLAGIAAKAGVLGVLGVHGAPARAIDGVGQALLQYELQTACALVWQRIDLLNRDIADKRPWQAPRAAPLDAWFSELAAIAHALSPILPHTAERIQLALQAGISAERAPLFPRQLARPSLLSHQTSASSTVPTKRNG